MKTREDKFFNIENTKSRTEKNRELYEQIKMSDIDKYDIDSNATILETNTSVIDVDKIRDMLDRKYRENLPEKKSSFEEREEVPKFFQKHLRSQNHLS